MEFKEIVHWINKIDQKLNEQYHDKKEIQILARTVKLSEEVGELCTEVLAHQGLQRKDKLEAHKTENITEECADVIFTTLLLAKAMNLDIEEGIKRKIEKINKR